MSSAVAHISAVRDGDAEMLRIPCCLVGVWRVCRPMWVAAAKHRLVDVLARYASERALSGL
jgi:hypothetical protein